MDFRRILALVAAALAVLALAACGGDDAPGADAAESVAEEANELATPEQREALREEARRAQDIIEGAIAELRDVRSLEDLEQHAGDAAAELEESRARIEALELAEEQQAARAQLLEAVETLEREVRELQATIADQDPVGALEQAGDLSIAELRAAVERIEREATR